MNPAVKHKRTVLAVDDDDVNLGILVKIAQGAGYNVRPFISSENAWNYLEQNYNDVDIALLDKMMPKVSGMDLLKRIKRNAALKHIPVIIQTGDAGTDQMREGMENGAYYYLTKPFLPAILTAILNSAENECNLRAELVSQAVEGQSKFLGLLREGEFSIVTHADARILAAMLSQLSGCPELIGRGLTELFYNAVEHGCMEIGYETKLACMMEKRWWHEVAHRLSCSGSRYRAATVHVQKNHTLINVTVTDPGKGFRWKNFLDRSLPLRLNEPCGRGIVIADRLLENLRYNAEGNEVQCAFNIKGSRSHAVLARAGHEDKGALPSAN